MIGRTPSLSICLFPFVYSSPFAVHRQELETTAWVNSTTSFANSTTVLTYNTTSIKISTVLATFNDLSHLTFVSTKHSSAVTIKSTDIPTPNSSPNVISISLSTKTEVTTAPSSSTLALPFTTLFSSTLNNGTTNLSSTAQPLVSTDGLSSTSTSSNFLDPSISIPTTLEPDTSTKTVNTTAFTSHARSGSPSSAGTTTISSTETPNGSTAPATTTKTSDGTKTPAPDQRTTTLPPDSVVTTSNGMESSVFPIISPPSATVTPPATNEEAREIISMLFLLRDQRDLLQNEERKQEFIEHVKDTNDDILALFHKIPDPPNAKPECSNLKRKRAEFNTNSPAYRRSLISGIIDNLIDFPSVVACATKVVDNLLVTVKAISPPIDIVESLTDTLEDLGKQLERFDNENKPTLSTSVDSTTTTSASSTSLTCTSGSAVPVCTEHISLVTTFSVTGTDTVTLVKTVTTSTCTTTTGCDVKASTFSTTTATATTTSAPLCQAGCSACQGPRKSILRNLYPREGTIQKRKLNDIKQSNWPLETLQRYFMGLITNGIRLRELDWGILNDAVMMTRNFENEAHDTYVAGLVGCTAILIISEKGLWFTHLAEPGFLGGHNEARWQRDIIGAFEGKNDRFIVPETLAVEGGMLNKANNPQIFVSTPYKLGTKERQYVERVDTIMNYLVGEGKAFNGVKVNYYDYVRPDPDIEGQEEEFRNKPNGKVFIQYDPEGFRLGPDQPVYRVWQETKFQDYTWCTGGAKRKRDGTCPLQTSSSKPLDSKTTRDGTTLAQPSISATSTDPPTTTGDVSSSTKTTAEHPTSVAPTPSWKARPEVQVGGGGGAGRKIIRARYSTVAQPTGSDWSKSNSLDI